MRNNHDRNCPWHRNFHECSCGYLEEEARRASPHDMAFCVYYLQDGFPCQDCTVTEAKPLKNDLFLQMLELTNKTQIDLNKQLKEEE